jgi:hypothetical protein
LAFGTAPHPSLQFRRKRRPDIRFCADYAARRERYFNQIDGAGSGLRGGHVPSKTELREEL